jgi:hypothetical protein
LRKVELMWTWEIWWLQVWCWFQRSWVLQIMWQQSKSDAWVCRPRSVLAVELSEQGMLRNLELWINAL